MRNQHDLGAKDFAEPLLISLYELSNGEADKFVSFKETHAPTCARLGVDIHQYGYGQNKRPQTIVWIGWAFTKYLRDAGLGKLKGRGKWALTDEGVARAKAFIAMDTTDTTDTPIEIPTIMAKVEDDTEPLVQTVGISLAVGPVSKTETHTYHTDPYIRSLAIAETKCFGYFASRSPVCPTCGLGGACRNKISAEMSSLAQTLAEEDQAAARAAAEAAALPVAEPAPQPTAPPVVTPSPAPTNTGTWDNSEAEIIVAHVAARCYRCSEPIEGGTEVYWIKDKGDRKGGLFHKECR